MKPKPFSGLNHFTVPVATANSLLPWPARTCELFVGLRRRRRARELLVANCDAEPSEAVYEFGEGPNSPGVVLGPLGLPKPTGLLLGLVLERRRLTQPRQRILVP